MKNLILILGLLVVSGYSQVTPCEDYACDSLAVRAILDSNGLTSRDINSVVEKIEDGRITRVSFNSLDLSTLPPEIGNLTGLKILELDSNKLTSLPPEIGQLSTLVLLKLSYNQLTVLTPDIGKLSVLDGLDLSNNKLTGLPPEIVQLQQRPFILSVESNYICSTTGLIEKWIDNNSYYDYWRSSQTLDGSHYCDGTGNEEPITKPTNNISISYTPFSSQVTITFPSNTNFLTIIVSLIIAFK